MSGGEHRDKSNKSSTSSGKYQHIYDSSFDYSLPRPPVLGEERTNSAPEWPAQYMDRHKYKSSSPIPPNAKQEHAQPPSSASPACLRWAHSLHNLLQDQEGVNLFLQYLESEGQQHAHLLHFWFACEGLKNHNQLEKIQRLVKLIYKTYFMKSALPIDDELRKAITRNMKSPQCLDPPVTLFDEAQAQIERLINNTTYPNFLKSDMYLQYLQSVQNPSSGGSDDYGSESGSSTSSIKELANLASGQPMELPTLHEEEELVLTPSGTGPFRLTKDVLLMSQKHRALDIRPKSEAYAGLFMYRSGSHAAYNSYNPVSRQDSERQSLSSHSDARTESDNMSITDSMIDGGRSGRSARHKSSLEVKHARELAALNKETDMHQKFIPRTQRMDVSKCLPMDLQQHAAILKEKLETVKREQESRELFDRRLKESDSIQSLTGSSVQSRELENAIREKLQLEDDNDQDILDEHVSRVFSDLTSPSMVSPRPLSPKRGRHMSSYVKPRRVTKDKDGFSTFSGDSGNVHDFADGSEHKLSMVKSKSVPEYGEERFVRVGSYRRSSSSKKTLTDLTDSGVSVVSDTPPVGVGGKESRVLTWLMESDKSGRGASSSHAHSEMSMRHRSSATSPITGKHRKGYGSRSNSLERNSVTGLTPAQPFVADPSMPPPPLPNIANQLDEARRRLEDDIRIKSRQKSKYYSELSQSGQSTLKKFMRSQQRPLPSSTTISVPVIEDLTTVVFSFCDEQFPYRTKIPGSQVTLRQFKEYLPKKGNYRFFFKTVCEDLGNQVTHEEVSNDSEVLPLWEGKIMAQVKPID